MLWEVAWYVNLAENLVPTLTGLPDYLGKLYCLYKWSHYQPMKRTEAGKMWKGCESQT
jgi:hypothetical protein